MQAEEDVRRTSSRLWVGAALAAALALMLVAQWLFVGRRVEPAAARDHIAQIQDALTRYHDDHGAFPTTREGLAVLRGHYLPAGVPRDPWGRPYRYLSPRRGSPDGYELYTLGRDGIEGGNPNDGDLYSASRGAVRGAP